MGKWWLVLCCLFLCCYSQKHPLLNQIFGGSQAPSGPTFYADPVGQLFAGFTNAIEKLKLTPSRYEWWPRYPGQKQTKDDSSTEINHEPRTNTVIPHFEGTIIESDYNPPSYSSQVSRQYSRDVDTGTNITHVPIDIKPGECSSQGTKVGDVRNICIRSDCEVTTLRCPPDFEIVDRDDYIHSNLSTCRVAAMQCYDYTITFGNWEITKIYQVIFKHTIQS